MTLPIRRLLFTISVGLLGAGPVLADPDALNIGPGAPDGLTATWTGGPYTGANPTNNVQDEPDCSVPGNPASCDDMVLTVDIPAGYTAANPTHILLVTVAWTPATANQDVDVYFQNLDGTRIYSPAATSANPEVASIQLVDGITTFRVRLLMYAAANLSFTGTVTIGAPPGDIPATGNYSLSQDLWSCNTHLLGLSNVPGPPPTVFDHSNDGEPAMRFDAEGRAYIGAIAGLPAGSGVWVTQDQCAQTYEFRGAVDAGLGGGDTDVETATSRDLVTGNYNVYVSSLTLANVTMACSPDEGITWALTPISTPAPIVDRQWNAAHGTGTVYLSYRNGATQPGNFLECVRLTYGPACAGPVTNAPIFVWDNAGANPPTAPKQLGNMATDRREHADNLALMAGPDGEGTIYHGYTQEEAGRSAVWVANSTDFNTTTPWNNVQVWEGPTGTTYDHIFTWVSVDQDGNVWTTFSDDANVYYSVSTDQGTTWSHAVRVNAGVQSKTAIFPHVAGGGGGRAAFTFYGHSGTGTGDPNAVWDVFVARTDDGLNAFQYMTNPPSFSEAIVNNRDFHLGPVCQGGLGCGCCRELLECYELDINPVDGRVMVVYGRFPGGSYITNQLTGTSALDGSPLADLSACPDPLDVPPCEDVVACLLDPPCQCPGCTIMADLDADDSPAVPIPAQNIRSVSVAEPHVSSGDPVGGDVMVFSLELEALDPQNLPPDTIWQVIFGTPTGQRWVRVVHCAATGDIAQYGHFETTTVVDGELPHFEYGNGVVCMWIPKSLIGNPQPGYVMVGITGHTRQSVGNCGGSPAAFPAVDNTNATQYTVAGNLLPACSPVGLEVSGFAARPFGSTVEISWTVSQGDRFRELRVDRGTSLEGPWSAAHTVQAPRRGDYSFVDRPAAAGRVFYRIVGVERSGAEVELGRIAATLLIQEYGFRLAGPNPFHERTAISYALPKPSAVRVDVYNVAGRMVRTLVNQREETGTYTVPFDGRSDDGKALGAGVYLVRIHAGEFRKTVRVVSIE